MKPFSTSQDNTGKVLTKAVKAADGTTVVLNYRKPEAAQMRELVRSLRLKGDRRPSMSLIARRSMGLYLDNMARAQRTRPDLFAREVEALEKMVTPIDTRQIAAE